MTHICLTGGGGGGGTDAEILQVWYSQISFNTGVCDRAVGV